jgi:hypothetical protein
MFNDTIVDSNFATDQKKPYHDAIVAHGISATEGAAGSVSITKPIPILTRSLPPSIATWDSDPDLFDDVCTPLRLISTSRISRRS